LRIGRTPIGGECDHFSRAARGQVAWALGSAFGRFKILMAGSIVGCNFNAQRADFRRRKADLSPQIILTFRQLCFAKEVG
jgi:hypothetical protein